MTDQVHDSEQPQAFDVALEKLPELVELLAKYGRKCESHSIPNPPRILRTEPFDRLWVKKGDSIIAGPFDSEVPMEWKDYSVHVVPMERVFLVGLRPVLSGWDFVATLEHLPSVTSDDGTVTNGGTILRTRPGVSELPERFRTATPDDCDHCNKRRKRNDTYVVHNVSTGEYAQVGSSCLQYFVANANPEAWMIAFAFEKDLHQALGGWGDGHSEFGVHIITFLAAVCSHLAKSGFYSKKMARADADRGRQARCPTGSLAWGDVTTDDPRDANEVLTRIRPYRDRAAEALEWMRNWDEESDYAHSVRTYANRKYVSRRGIGYLAAAMHGWLRSQDIDLRGPRLTPTCNEYLPGVSQGDKLVSLTLTIVDIGSPSSYGSCKVRMLDEGGRLVIWWASNPSAFGSDLQNPGTKVTVDATVKALGEWQGYRETVLTHVKPHVDKPVRKTRKNKV